MLLNGNVPLPMRKPCVKGTDFLLVSIEALSAYSAQEAGKAEVLAEHRKTV